MGRDKKTHVSYLWRINLILSYLFLRSSVGFRFCVFHIWLVCATPCCKIKENPSRSAACWHNQHLCFLALTCITLLTCKLHGSICEGSCTFCFWSSIIGFYFDTAHILLTVDTATPGSGSSSCCKTKDKRKSSRDWSLLAKSALVFSTFDPFQ